MSNQTTVTVRLDAGLLEAAALALGVDPAGTPAATAAAVLRAASGRRRPSAVADGGAAPKRAGRSWERTMISYANQHGMTWDLAPLRGTRDLLDVTGCLPGGWLVGAKAVARDASASRKLPAAMDQAARALEHLPAAARSLGFAGAAVSAVIPWQVIQRHGAEPGRAYAVTEFDHMLAIARMRDEWKQEQ